MSEEDARLLRDLVRRLLGDAVEPVWREYEVRFHATRRRDGEVLVSGLSVVKREVVR